MKLFTVVYNDARLLPPFLRHYGNAGIKEFYLATAPEYSSTAREYAEHYEIFVIEGLDVTESMSAGSAAVGEMRRLHQQDAEWVVIVDLDEFIEFDETITQVVSAAEDEGANVVRGIMYDRFTRNGRLSDFEPNADLSKIYPVKSRFVRDVMGGCDHKGVLVKGKIMGAPRGGHHWFAGERVFSRTLEISHYKWNSTSIMRVKRAHEALVAMGIPWAIEYKRVIDHYEQHGRFAWEEFGGE